MSEDGFLKRWSRRKRAEDAPESAPAKSLPSAPPRVPGQALPMQAEQGTAPLPSAHGVDVRPAAPAGASAAHAEDEAVDPATLPPIESLGQDSDYTVFLRKGVPEALRTAALRRAWITDPAIRDFPSPAVDYAWDFNTPEFALRPTDNVEKLLDQIFPPKAPDGTDTPASAPAAAPEDAPAEERGPAANLSLPQKQAAADQAPSEIETVWNEPSAPRSKHGGALPE